MVLTMLRTSVTFPFKKVTLCTLAYLNSICRRVRTVKGLIKRLKDFYKTFQSQSQDTNEGSHSSQQKWQLQCWLKPPPNLPISCLFTIFHLSYSVHWIVLIFWKQICDIKTANGFPCTQ